MSLVGNLEDLSLGDLLQIVSLSQKSGVLALESGAGTGLIVFRAGLVHAAGIKGRSPDLRGLLVSAGLIEADRFDAALAAVGAKAPELPARLAAHLGIDLDPIDALIRKSAEAAIFEMFAWETGEFSFDARREGDGVEMYPCLQSGLNAQYLAMEGMRLRDEQARAEPAPEIELSDELFFGSDSLETDSDAELELESELAVEPVPVARAAPVAATVVVHVAPGPLHEAVELVAARVATRSEVGPSDGPVPASDASMSSRPVVVIEPDAMALEWIKAGIEGRFARVHVFQRAEQGLARIRQYLIRGDVPFVLIAISAPIDPLSGIHGLADFVKRLRAQAPRIVVVGLREESAVRVEAVPSYLDAVLTRPPRKQLRGASAGDAAAKSEALARELAEIVSRRSSGVVAAPTPTPTPAKDKNVPPAAAPGANDALFANARSQNEIFTIALDAAARIFARAAILVLRDDELFAVAGRGIEALEVDPLSTSPRFSCRVPDAGLLRQVISAGRPITTSPRSEADRLFVAMFGPIEPKAVYLAPIRVPGGGLAILYADQGGTRRPTSDTAPLEQLLEEASDVLERIAAHRAEGEARTTSS